MWTNLFSEISNNSFSINIVIKLKDMQWKMQFMKGLLKLDNFIRYLAKLTSIIFEFNKGWLAVDALRPLSLPFKALQALFKKYLKCINLVN